MDSKEYQKLIAMCNECTDFHFATIEEQMQLIKYNLFIVLIIIFIFY